MAKKGKAPCGPRTSSARPQPRAQNPHGADEIETFHKSKDKLALNPEEDSDLGEDILGSEEEGVLDIEDPSDEEGDSEDSAEDGDLEGDKRLAACALSS